MDTRKEFMLAAIQAAKEPARSNEYAIGAVIVRDNEIIATGEVRRVRDTDPTAHAEVVAIRNACSKLNTRSLKDCTIYSTQECCPMCAAAVIWAKMNGIVFGAYSSDVIGKGTNKFSWRQIGISCREVLNKSSPRLELVEGFMRQECIKLIELSR